MKNNNNKNYGKEAVDQLRGKEAEQWTEFLWDELLTKLSDLKSKKELKRALESLTSEHERKTILRRLAVNALVRSGKSYRKIGEVLWIAPQTISAVKKNSFNMTSSYRSYRSSPRQSKFSGPVKIEKEKSFSKSLFENIDLWDLLTNPPRPSGIGLVSSARSFNGLKKRK